MESTSENFIQSSRDSLVDEELQQSLARFRGGFAVGRAERAAQLPEFEQLRDISVDIKNHTLENLDYYLECFADKVEETGGIVHWCLSPDDARNKILEICQNVEAKLVTKSKSMIGEEIGLNEFLENNKIEPIETDLGEYIIQLAEESPSHIIAPAVHKTKEQVARLFQKHHKSDNSAGPLDSVEDLVNQAREVLRHQFLSADVGITGANFLIAETGSTAIVTNEGNGDLTQILPKVHIVLATLEKVIPTLNDMTTILRVLARSGTGQEFSAYTTLSTGPKRKNDHDGPEEFHVVLLDNGRSEMLGSEYRDLLRCIKCGACMNHCPVYGSVGGHAYGWVYPGPVGAVLTPNLIGLEKAHHLPNASTFCGRCEAVCPVRIPLPDLMRRLRRQQFESGLLAKRYKLMLKAWAWLAKHPFLYRKLTGLGLMIFAFLANKRGSVRDVPFAKNWTAGRDLPVPEGESFHSLWRKRSRK